MNHHLPAVLKRLYTGRGWTLATAESYTGGLLGGLITGRPGSSEFYLGGVIAYSDRIKNELLSVGEDTLEGKGAVSPETARAMARGVRDKFRSTIGAAVTGIAGPGGGNPGKPVGLVYVAVAGPVGERVERYLFSGSRREIRLQAVREALRLLVAAAGPGYEQSR